MEPQALLEELPPSRYADLRVVKRDLMEASLREDGVAEVFEGEDSVAVGRVLVKGLAVYSTNRVNRIAIKEILARAFRHATQSDKIVKLSPVKVEVGKAIHRMRKGFNYDEVVKFLNLVVDVMRTKAFPYISKTEVSISYNLEESHLTTSEGTDVLEKKPQIEVRIRLALKSVATGYSSRTIGGSMGFELLDYIDAEKVAEEMVREAKDWMNAKQLSPIYRGNKFKVVLDEEAAGALAHELSHTLEGGKEPSPIVKAKVPEGLTLVDNPSVPGAYGSFVWDSEGVRGGRKILLCVDSINFLHTRFTVEEGGRPGNARGAAGMPTPMFSNVYFERGDWKTSEIVEETRNGFYLKGAVKSEINVLDGSVVIKPQIAYLIEDGDFKTSVKGLALAENVFKVIRSVDAIGGSASLKPNSERGLAVSEGGPHIRIYEAKCI
ncbi:MAG: TldD/PmbA family protein [Nitrososphaeria archaeon]